MKDEIKEILEQLNYAIAHSEEPKKAKRYYDAVIDLQQELERYKNIVDELERWLKENTIQLYNEDNQLLLDETFIKYATERKMAYMYVLDKLKELKGE